MLNKKTSIYFVAAILLLSGLWFDRAVGDDEDVVHSNLLWDCPDRGDERYCNVSLELVNRTSAPQVRKVTIRGIRVFSGKDDADGQICGQIIFSILLEPREIVVIGERMPVSAIPDSITVSIRE